VTVTYSLALPNPSLLPLPRQEGGLHLVDFAPMQEADEPGAPPRGWRVGVASLWETPH
jgi:hypothetical protein